MSTIYPFNLLTKTLSPLFIESNGEAPIFIDLSKDNLEVESSRYKDQREFNNYMFGKLSESGKKFAVSGYLENRMTSLKKYPQMLKEGRFYHLGVDITAALGTDLHAPLDGEVVVSEYEEGEGNYGGMIVLKHVENGVTFYSLYGHLNRKILLPIGSKVKKGEKFAKIGDFDENGNWFHHTHLQVFTEEGFNSNYWVHRGYCSEKDIATIDKFCPNPAFLLRF
jgi:murein DD-endopeptidase MepM/ murein hydrolase activator NlpD